LEMIADVQVQSDPVVIAEKWEAVQQAVHDQAMFLPLWGTRVPFVLNRRFGGFTPSTQTYAYPLDSVRVYSGSPNVTVAPGAGGSLFKSVGPVNPHQYFPNQLFVQSWVYEGLVGYGQDGELTPILATSWELEDLASGGRRYTFTLREGVKFHDGSDWNCSVAKLNFDHVLSEIVKQRHQWYGTPQQLESWTCTDAGKFVLETKEKYYPLLQELSYIRPLTFASASAFAMGLDSHPDDHNSCVSGDFGSKWAFLEDSITCAGLKPIGTGPFKLAKQVTNADGVDTEAVFARHDAYWGAVPEIENLHLKYYENTDDVMADLLTGDLDMALGIGPLTAKQIQTLKFYHSDVVDVRHSDVMQHALMIMNTNANHTKDVETRRAIIHAVDKTRFIKKEFAGLEQPVTQLLPYNAPYCNVDLNPKWAYDFEKAELLNCAVIEPPSPPPPPPAASTYTFNVIAEGAPSNFDSAKLNSIKTSIATKAGVSASDVTVSISVKSALAALVYIIVNIQTTATVPYGSIADKLDPYLTSASEATELLGGSSVVTVVNVASAPVPYPQPKDASDDIPEWAVVVIAVICVLFAAVLAFACVMYYREKQGKPMFQMLEGTATRSTSSKDAPAVQMQAHA